MIKIPKVGEIFVEIFAKNQRLRGGLAQASSLIRDWSLVVTGLTQGITNAFKTIATVGIRAVTIAMVGLAGTFALVAKSGAEFQDNIVRAFVIMRESSGATEDSLRELTNEAIRLGSETLFSATQAAIGLQTLARAGFDTQQAISAIGPVLDLAIVGNIELAEASNIAVASMFGFGLEATDMTKVVDVLALASSQANTTISLLGSALGFVAPVAFSAGISIEETAAAIGVLSNAGIRGSRAGTTLRRALSILLAPTGRAKKIFDELGLSFNSTEGGLISFIEIIAKLNKANLTAAETQTIFGRIAGPGMAALLRQGAGALENLTNKLEGAQGAADRMSQAFRTTVKGRVRDLGASIINLGLAFSEKFNKPLADTIFAVRNFVKDITEALQKTEIFKAAVDGTISALSPLTDRIKELASGFKDFLLGLTPEKIVQFFEIIRIKIDEFIKKLEENTAAIVSFFKGAITTVGAFIKPVISLLKAFDGLSDGTKKTVGNLVGLSITLLILTGGIVPLISFVVLLALAFRPLRLAIIAFITALIRGSTVMGAFGVAAGILGKALILLLGHFGRLITFMALVAAPIIAAAAAGVLLGTALAAISKGIENILSGSGGFVEAFDEMFGKLGGLMEDLLSGLPNIFGKSVDKMKSQVENANIFASLPGQLESAMSGAKIEAVTKEASAEITLIGGETLSEQLAAMKARFAEAAKLPELPLQKQFGGLSTEKQISAIGKVSLINFQGANTSLSGRLPSTSENKGIISFSRSKGESRDASGSLIDGLSTKDDNISTLGDSIIKIDDEISTIKSESNSRIIALLTRVFNSQTRTKEEEIKFAGELKSLGSITSVKTGEDDRSTTSSLGNSIGVPPRSTN